MTRSREDILNIKDKLLRRVEAVAERYAPFVKGAYVDHQGRYFTLNPGRADRHVGSFYIHTAGSQAGTWRDHATGEYGDLIDLIALNLNCSAGEALSEARSYLGLQHTSDADRRRHERAARVADQRRKEARANDAKEAERRARRAHALWLSGQASLRGTPVDLYLRQARGIDLSVLGRQPRALRYVPKCRYYHMDQKTGEVIEGAWPAMVAIMIDGAGRAVACHRTWLARNSSGIWDKAPVPSPRKVLAPINGSAIMIWRGIGPRGGKPASLRQCPPGTQVFVTEGIEDALSGVLLRPEDRWIAAYSLGNIAQVALPANVSKVTICADNDLHQEQRDQLQHAVKAHQAAGRTVAVWHNKSGGKDLNDALRARQAAAKGVA